MKPFIAAAIVIAVCAAPIQRAAPQSSSASGRDSPPPCSDTVKIGCTLNYEGGGEAVAPAMAADPPPPPGTRCSGAAGNRPPSARLGVARTEPGPADSRKMELRTTASDPDGDPLTFVYSVTAGRIVESGATAEWTVTGQGNFTATVEVSDGKGCMAFASTVIILEREVGGIGQLGCNDPELHPEYDDIVRACTRLLELQTKGVASGSRITTLKKRGQARAALGDHDLALADFNMVIEASPRFARAYNERGNVHALKRDMTRAKADYEQAIRLDPDYAAPHFSLGFQARFEKDFTRAIAEYNEMIRIEPNSGSGHYYRGLTYQDMGDQKRAIADFDALIRIDEGESILGYWRRGIAFAALGDHRRAVEDFDRAIELDDLHPEIRLDRAKALEALGEKARAAADRREAARLKAQKDAAHVEFCRNLRKEKPDLPSTAVLCP